MTSEEKIIEILDKHFGHHVTQGSDEWYTRNYQNRFLDLQEMAEWKDKQTKGFFFELALLLTTPKTDLEHAMRMALPMSGLNAIDEILDFLNEKLWEYNNNGTILKDNNK